MTPDQSYTPPPGRRQPVFNAPRVVVWLVAALVVSQVLFEIAPMALKEFALRNGALIPQHWMGLQLPYDLPFTRWFSLVGHALLHGDWGHLIMNAIGLFVFGAITARRLGERGFLIFFVVCAIAGGAFYLAWGVVVDGFDAGPAVGASSAISGLLPPAIMIKPHDPHGRLVGLTERNVYAAAIAFVVIHVLIALFGEPLLGMRIAWQAHIGGFFAGLLLFPLFDRKFGVGARGR